MGRREGLTAAAVTALVAHDLTETTDWGMSVTGVQWMHNGAAKAPIGAPFNVTSMTYFWLVSAPIPTTTVDGPYSVVLSATSVLTPSEVRWASDLVWVGRWVAPPLDERYKVYLPLVVR